MEVRALDDLKLVYIFLWGMLQADKVSRLIFPSVRYRPLLRLEVFVTMERQQNKILSFEGIFLVSGIHRIF